jgi:hypothetical protein
MFVDASGTEVAINPHGIARIKDKLYIVDYDSQKIVVIEKDELENMPRGGARILNVTPCDLSLDTTAALPAGAKGQAVVALQDGDGEPFLYALYLAPDNTGALTNNILIKLSVAADGSLACDAHIVAGCNAEELCPVQDINNRDIVFLPPATGGN